MSSITVSLNLIYKPIKYSIMKLSKRTNSNDQGKILKMISRDEELIRNDGKWVAVNRPFKNKKKYDRKQNKRELSRNLDSSLYLF